MRRYIFVLAVISAVGMLGLASGISGTAKEIKEGGILNVRDIQADPSGHKGTITITGVVAGKAITDSKMFAIVDTSEAKTCKSTGCANFYLPVRYEGERPKEWDEVQVTGMIMKGVFAATKVSVLRHLTF